MSAPPTRAETARGPWTLLAAALGLGLLALNVYRAATQSVTHDEALTFLWFVTGPLERVFADFQPNNHVLHTALAWLSMRQLGLSELALRLPSLLGGALCLGAGFAACRALLGSRAAFLLGYALLALNPLLLDFLSAARGYGLGLGFLLLGLVAALRLADGAGRPAWRAGAVALCVLASVAANLSLAPAGAGLLLVTALAAGTDSRAPRRGLPVALLLAPLALAAAGHVLGWRALPDAARGATLVGLPSWSASVTDLVQRSLGHHDVRWPLDTRGALFAGEVRALAFAGVPLLLAALALFVARHAWRMHALPPCGRALVFAAGTLVLAVVVWSGLHLAARIAWPMDRTGLPFVALAGPCAVALAMEARARGGAWRAAGKGALALLVVLALQQAAQLQASHYAVWRHDAGARRVMQEVRERQAARGGHPSPGSVRLVLGSWVLEPALSFYRLQTRTTWLAPIGREPFDPGAPWDWLVTLPPLPPEAGDARVVYEDPVSGVLLLEPAASR